MAGVPEAPEGLPMAVNTTALVTGSTDGLGRAVALRLAAAKVHVIVHGRDRERGDRLVGDIRAGGGEATFYQADLSSLAAVRALAARVRANHPGLNLLINNAGLGTGARGGRRELSADGHEIRFAVNYLAGFLLTHLLLPALLESRSARIVNVASAGQYPLDLDNLMLPRAYSGLRAYAQSKLAQIMFTFDLARELRARDVSVNALHPATYMDTHMVRESGTTPASTVQEGAAAVFRLAISPEVSGCTGEYFDGQQPGRAHSQAYDEFVRRRLRELSVALCGLEEA